MPSLFNQYITDINGGVLKIALLVLTINRSATVVNVQGRC